MSGEFYRCSSSRNSSSRELKPSTRYTSGDPELQPFSFGKESSGYVVTLKEEFGFVKALNGDEVTQVFFHISEVIPPYCDTGKATDLRNILKTGDEVKFTVQPARGESGKLHAKRVRKLGLGTDATEEVDPTVRRGCVRCDHNGDLYITPVDDDEASNQTHAVKKLKFSRHKHVRPGSHQPQVDDVVEFNVVIDHVRGTKRAKNIEVIAQAPSELSMQGREVGHVISLSEQGGQIRALEGAACIAFHSDGCTPATTFSRLTCMCEVSYSTARAPGGISYAKEIKLLPPGTITAKEALGIVSGMVERMPSENATLGKDGLISYSRGGQRSTVAFGLQDIHEFLPCLHAGDECRFDLMRNKFSQQLSVHGVTLMLRQNQGFEFGIVSMLKKNFGFIKCSERVVDVFFHINALLPTSTPLSMDADVRFLPALDDETGKIIATELEVVASGTAKFEAVSDRRYSGTVKALAGVRAGHAEPPEGIITALVDGRLEALPYRRSGVQGSDQPALDQKVTFRVLEDRRAVMIAHKSARGSLKVQNGGRRAIEVLAVPCGNPQASARSASPSSFPSSRQSSQSSAIAAAASMQVRSQNESSRPSSRDASPVTQQAMRDDTASGMHSGPAAESVREDTDSTAPGGQPSDTGATPSKAPPKAIVPAAAPAELPPSAERVRGTVIRVLKKAKHLPAGASLGIIRSASNDSWAKAKQPVEGGSDGHALSNALRTKGLPLIAVPGDVLFWSTHCRPPTDDAPAPPALKKGDSVEYVVLQLPIEEGDEQLVDAAVDITLVRSARSAAPAQRRQPPAAPFPAAAPRSSSGMGRKAPPKFQGTATVVVPGPEKGDAGFQAGRGRALEQRDRVNSFRFEDVVSATAFVPKVNGTDGGSASAVADALAAARVDGQFDDAAE